MALNNTNIKFNTLYQGQAGGGYLNSILQATSGGTVFSANQVANAAHDYFANTPAVNDAYYVGITTGSNSQMGFAIARTIALTVGTALNGTPTLVWEYWNGAWVTLTTDNLNAMATVGTQTINWTPPTDWIPVNPANTADATNGTTTGLYIRCRITATTGVTEGGANATTKVQWGSNAIHIIDNASGTAVTLEDIYDTATDAGNLWPVNALEMENTATGIRWYRFGCYLEVGRAADSKTGYIDFGTKGSNLMFDDGYTLINTSTTCKADGGVNIDDEFGVLGPSIRTNQQWACRQFLYFTARCRLYGIKWENTYQNRAAAYNSSNVWEIGQFGTSVGGVGTSDIITFQAMGFGFFPMLVNTADGILKGIKLTEVLGLASPTGFVVDDITLDDVVNNFRFVQAIGAASFTNTKIAGTYTYIASTFANTVNRLIIDPIDMPALGSASFSWNSSGNTGYVGVAYKVNVKVVDSQTGNTIENARVQCIPDGANENSNNFDTVTNSSGNISSDQTVTKEFGLPSSGTGPINTSTITNYDPFTIKITKPGYEPYIFKGALDRNKKQIAVGLNRSKLSLAPTIKF